MPPPAVGLLALQSCPAQPACFCENAERLPAATGQRLGCVSVQPDCGAGVDGLAYRHGGAGAASSLGRCGNRCPAGVVGGVHQPARQLQHSSRTACRRDTGATWSVPLGPSPDVHRCHGLRPGLCLGQRCWFRLVERPGIGRCLGIQGQPRGALDARGASGVCRLLPANPPVHSLGVLMGGSDFRTNP